jgi:hypothetical protein
MPDAYDSFGVPREENSNGAGDSIRQGSRGSPGTLGTEELGGAEAESSRRLEKQPERGRGTEGVQTQDPPLGGEEEWKAQPVLVDQVSSYRRGAVSRTQAVLKGSAHVEALVGKTQESRDRILTGFLDELRSGGSSSERSRIGGSDGERGALPALLTEAIRHGTGGGGRGGEEETEEVRGWGEGEELEGEGSRGQKRPREEEFPWFEDTKRFNEARLSESSRQTRAIIERARRDITLVQSWLQMAHGAPANFPGSEWTNIL